MGILREHEDVRVADHTAGRVRVQRHEPWDGSFAAHRPESARPDGAS
jgi:hypothetical protein